MSDPTLSVDNIIERCITVAVVKQHIANRMRAFSALSVLHYYNWLGTSDTSLIESIDQLEPPFAVVAYSGSEYGTMPMADRAFSVWVGISCVIPFVLEDFSLDPMEALRTATIGALDKFIPEGQCIFEVKNDESRDVSQELAVCEITLRVQDV